MCLRTFSPSRKNWSLMWAGFFRKNWARANLIHWVMLPVIPLGLMNLNHGMLKILRIRRFLFRLTRRILSSWNFICRRHLSMNYTKARAIAVCSCACLLRMLSIFIVSMVPVQLLIIHNWFWWVRTKKTFRKPINQRVPWIFIRVTKHVLIALWCMEAVTIPCWSSSRLSRFWKLCLIFMAMNSLIPWETATTCVRQSWWLL